ncbi:MAG: DUF1385 domain-containing protein [Oligoflexia bacterium]|nr:DUF1385 domain-containing protein [Oligoflexia bacterium]
MKQSNWIIMCFFTRILRLLCYLPVFFITKLVANESTSEEQKKYSSIGGQAVIDGVMMRSPHAFVVALRLPNGKIRLRRDQWFGLGKKFPFFKKFLLRGVLAVIEAMANGVVALNYSANVAMTEELKKEQAQEKEKEETRNKEEKNKEDNNNKENKKEEKEGLKSISDKIGIATFITMIISLLFGIVLFVFVPHWITILVGYKDVESFKFHFIDGIIKATIFVLYVFLIGLIPDIKKIFCYHGAEHKAIATFENKEELTIENARKYSTLHPRCGTSFIFFLIFISILFFSIVFSSISIAPELPFVLRHLVILCLKVLLMFPVAGVSYEILKYAGTHSDNNFCKIISFPGMILQRITTNEPTNEQLEVALASIKTVLFLEEKHKLKEQESKILTVEELEIEKLSEIEKSNATVKDFIE